MNKIKYEGQNCLQVNLIDATSEVENLHLEKCLHNYELRNSCITRISQTVAHEMRAPCHGIKTSADQLCKIYQCIPKGYARLRFKRILKMIYFQTHHLLCLLNDQLDMKLIQANKYK